MNKNTILALFAVAVMVAATVHLSQSADADSTTTVLIDKGNGQTYWTEESGTTLDEVFKSAFSAQNMVFSSNGSIISVDGNSSITIGGTACSWRYYEYNSGWSERTYSGNASCPGTAVAVGYYPGGYVPTVTPEYKTAWTMIHADSLNSGSITNYDPSEYNATLAFTYAGADSVVPACYASALYANGHVYFLGAEFAQKVVPKLYCHMIGFDCSDGSIDWDITYMNNGYALATGCIYGDSVYFSAVSGKISKIPLSGADAGTITKSYILTVYPTPSTKSTVMVGASSVVYNSGHIYVASNAGEVVCLTPDLELVWKTNIGAAVYPSTSVSVTNGYVYIGACDGKLYILDQTTGETANSLQLYVREDGEVGGRVGVPAVLGEYIIVSYNDGTGMSCSDWGAAVLKFNSSTKALTLIKNLPDLEVQSGYLVISPTNGYVYGTADDALYRIYIDGTYDKMFDVTENHGGYTLVNNTYFYGTEYDSKGAITVYNMSGDEVSYSKTSEIQNFSMGSTVIAGQYIIATTDSGAMILKGALVDGKDTPEPTPPKPEPPTPTSSEVKFLIADGSGMYFTINGSGEYAVNALINALSEYKYSDYAEFSGTSSNPTGLRSLFGLEYKQIDTSTYQYWMTFVWNDTSNTWEISTENLGSIISSDCGQILLYYGRSDETSAPSYLPVATNLKPLVKSGTGTRFLIESEKGSFIVINGTGNTVENAFTDACKQNSVPCTVDGTEITLYGISSSSEYRWNTFTVSSSEWKACSDAMSSLSSASIPIFGLYYCSNNATPTIPASTIWSDGDSTSDSTDCVPYILATILIALIIAIVAYLLHIKKTQEMPVLAYLRTRFGKEGFSGSKVKQNKRKLLIVCTIGLIATFFMFLASIAVGPSVTLSLPDAFSALISAIHKHGQNLTFNEIIVYESRLPRAIAAVAVGIGLSIAGCVYQAIIRNPLVDPYVMGVSSGAGTFAVAAISANFTFFGLLSSSNFATPILAIMGGLIAFGLTLIIAEKAGGSSTNYVLAGVVIGLVFSAIQTLLLVTSSTDKLNSAISWLFGSFANVGWDTVWIIFFPAIFLAIVPLFWAKELNLVLLGEDQAKQMGLDVRKFNRWMLILASVLTSVCVAFVGIIGFVGMVIPHLCRMLLGGDHRLVLPASIMMGGALMLFADLMAKMLMIPTELPVGAITTIIGVPVFAYLLIKKGRMYSG